jgi:hypothetical protein
MRVWRTLAAMAILVGVADVSGARAFDTSALRTGDDLGVVSGRSLEGQSVSVPVVGAPCVLLFGFSRAAGADSQRWGDALAKDAPGLPVYSVIELESVPRPLRRMVEASIRAAMPGPARKQTIVLMKDEALWRERLGVGDPLRAYVLLLDREGRIAWESSGSYSAQGTSALLTRLRTLR